MHGRWGITYVLLAVGVSAIALAYGMAMCRADTGSPEVPADYAAAPYRMHYAYAWSDEDLVGDWSDDVGAAAILLRANGLEPDRGRLASNLNVESDYDEAVAFAEGLNRSLPTTEVAVPIAYDYIQFLPAPSVIWIFDGVETRPVVFLCADEAQVEVADPRCGVRSYGFTELSRMYEGGSRQAVCLADRGYTATSG